MNDVPAVLTDDDTLPDGPSSESSSVSLAVALSRAEVDQQTLTARAWPRSVSKAIRKMVSHATRTEETARECVYAVPRGGKLIRGPSVRFAEIVLAAWGNCRSMARVTHEDRIERYVEAQGAFIDLETNVGYQATTRRTIEMKKGKRTVDQDMMRLAGAAACSIARRNAILGAVGKGNWVEAYERVEAVLRGDLKTLGERRDIAIKTLAGMGVSPERVFLALHVGGIEDITLDHLVDLTAARNSLKGGEATIDELFPEERPEPKQRPSLDEKLDALAGAPPTSASEPSDAPRTPTGEAVTTEDSPPKTSVAASQAADTGASPVPKDAPAEPGGAPPAQEAATRSDPHAKPAAASPAGRPQRTARAARTAEASAASAQEGKALDGLPEGATAEDRRIALQRRVQDAGDQVATQGGEALASWLDGLKGDEAAVVTVAMTKRWMDAAANRTKGATT